MVDQKSLTGGDLRGSEVDSSTSGSPHLELVIDLREPSQPQERPWLTPEASLLRASPRQLKVKRVVDITVGLLAIVLLLPLTLIAAVATKLSSRGPIFYKQLRSGVDGNLFEFYKFRSMETSADYQKPELVELNEASGPVFKIRQDPRLTPVGSILRRTSIDELPQLWNVLKGDMCLVGPRPPLPEEVNRYSIWEAQRLTVKPGITGIWQVSGRSELDFETWVCMDIEYIENWSLWLDIKLLARTIPAVLSGRGAY